MLEPAVPFDEASRLATLRGLNILDTSPEERFDRLTRLAQHLLDVPIALVSLVDANRQWFKSCQGLDASETPRSISFCGHAILDDQLFVIPDALLDPRFADNPLVTSAPHIRFYAGQPLKAINGSRVGTLCVIDRKPHQLTQAERDSLRDLALLVENELNLLDIKDATHALINSQNRLSAVLDNILDGIITINERGTVESFNKSAVKIFGYHADEVIGHNVKMLMPEPYHNEHDGYLHHFATTGEKKVIGIGRQVIGKRKEGSTFPMDLAVSEMKLGDARMFTGIVRDITERKKVEELQAQFLAIVESSTDAIMSKTLDGIVTSWNPAAEKMFGYAAHEMIGQPMALLIPPDRSEEEPQILAKIRRGENIEHFETMRRKKNGDVFPISVTISPIRDLSGVIIGASKIARDISERVKIERMKSEFISTVSHELRTPLTSIRGSLGLIAGGVAGELPAQAKSLVDIAHKNSERLILLVNDILDMEKIEAGKMEFQPKPIELRTLLEQALEGNRAYAEQYKVTYELKENLAGVMVNVDANRLLQVLANLLSNAAKFSRTGGKVTVDSAINGNIVHVSVQDHGSGISEQFRSQVFQKFAQADSSDTRKKGGTGLGLSITKSIVEQMGGRIGFNSQPDILTTFWVEFPVWQAEGIIAPETFASGKQKRVLICEDDSDIATLLRLMLEQAGLPADIAYNAAQAKKMLAQHSYAAMTLDLDLPDQNGILLIRELRTIKETATLPIVVVSANAIDGRKELNIEAFSVIDWISKPINQEQLILALRQAVGQASPTRPTVLHVEDDPDIVQVVRGIVGDVADLENAPYLIDARRMLAGKRYDLVILDLVMPDGSGKELLPLLNNASPPIPVVVFSANEMGMKEMQGVDSALVKSRTDNAQLLATIKKLIGVD